MVENGDVFGEPVFSYSSVQAEADGILFNVTHLNKEWAKGLFNFVTVNLLEKGYIEEGKGGKEGLNVKIACIVDLLNQCNHIVKRAKTPDYFYSGLVELPSGQKQKVFISQNETGKFTIMLPEDY